jgi:hypothetical protein
MLLTSQDGSIAAEIAYDPWGVEIVGATEPSGRRSRQRP